MIGYLGHHEGLDYMQMGDSIFVWVAGRWCEYTGLVDWFSTVAGQAIRRAFWGGFRVLLGAG